MNRSVEIMRTAAALIAGAALFFFVWGITP